MNGGDIILIVATAIYGPLIVYPLLGVPFMLALLAFFLMQDAVGGVCRLFGWQRPAWAIPHTERTGFANIDA
jgi:hypothetical protein